MRWTKLLVTAGSAVALAAGSAHAENWSPEKTSFAKALMQNTIGTQAGQSPGLSAGVSINGKPVFTTGAGEASPGVPATEFTGYEIGSVTKQLTAATMLALIEKQGGTKFSLETKLKDTLPDSFPFSKYNTETIRNLLNMQTGYADYTKPPANTAGLPDGAAPIERSALRGYVYSLLRQHPSTVPPGTAFKYLNTNYYLTSLMIEQLGGFSDYRLAMKQYVFQPAGMTHSGFVGVPPAGVPMALPPFDTAKSVVNKPDWPRGAGDVISTVNDLLNWHAALVTGKILGNAAKAAMISPPPGSSYGMGWNVVVTPPYVWLNHGGVIAGYTSFSGIFSNATTKGWVSVAVLSNNDKVPVDMLGTCFAQLAMDPSPTLKGLGAAPKLACGISSKMFGVPSKP